MNSLILKKGREKLAQAAPSVDLLRRGREGERQAGRDRSKCATSRASRWRSPPTARSRRSGRGCGRSMPPKPSTRIFSSNRIQKALALREAPARGEAHQCAAPGPRRVGRPAGAGGRPLRRRAGGAVPRRRRRALARRDPGSAGGNHRLRGDLRALGRRGAQAGGPGAASRLRARQPQRLALPDHRARPQLPRRRRAGPEDRLLPRPAREPPARARARRRARGARRLLLYRRLRHRRARRRREARHRGRIFGRRARGREGKSGRQPAGRRAASSSCRPTCSSTSALLRDKGAQVRPDRARSAEVRADRGARQERGARLQGHQPAGAQAARARRPARHLLLLRRRLRGAVPVDRRRRGAGRGRGGENHRALRRRRRPPGGAGVSGRAIT